MADSLIGGLLVAGPRLIDPNFFRTVVLLCGHDADGALGLVLNRPTDLAVGDYLPGWVERLTRPEVVFAGGPVQPDTAIGLGRRSADAPNGWSQVAGDLGLVDLTLAPAAVVGDISALRVFAGYAGWGSGQLAAEVEEGSWYVVPSEPADLFADTPERLWARVLRRQPGELAWVSTAPLDPTMN